MGTILDMKKWNQWCNNTIKNSGKQSSKLYSEDFTNDIVFEKLIQGCFYCGDFATTIDRLDSSIKAHTVDNCVGCCYACNTSKGASDPITFLLKAYYYAYGDYFNDNVDIWYVHKTKPRFLWYKNSAEKKQVSFELSRENFNVLTTDKCYYCERNPINWFGIDRIKPSEGYVMGNVVTCCFDCNLDKHINSVEETARRNKKIAERLKNDHFDLKEFTNKVSKSKIHKGISLNSKKVCAYGRVYENRAEASRDLGKAYTSYVSICIRDCIHLDDIFDISEEFYNEYKDSELYITKTMYVSFKHFYTFE
jgi:5-methylcytosine-specific restriction endonuclease McrA